MKSYDKTLTRLILILTKLSNNDKPTIQDLANEFGVGIRTIQRDIYQKLNYFPIEKNSLGYLQFIDGFTLDKSTLDNDEMLLTYLALSQVKDISNNFKNKIDAILSKLLVPTFNTPYYIKANSFEKIDMDSGLLNSIEKSIKYKYISAIKTKYKVSQVEPYKIICLDGIWYLFAKDLIDMKIKSFLISNILSFTSTTKLFKIDKPIDEILSNVHSAWFDDGSSFSVTIKVEQDIAYYFKAKKVLPTQEILKENSDGSLIISFEVTHYEDIDNIIKAWLPNIKVLDPTNYQEKIINELEGYINSIDIPNDPMLS